MFDNEWYSIYIPNAKRQNRQGFNGSIAKDNVRNLYTNKSIAHTKKKGAANPIKYFLQIMQLTKTDFIQYLNCPELLRLLKNKLEIYPKGKM